MIIQTECFRESSCKHCKTAMVEEKNQAAFLGLPPWEFEGKYYYLASQKKNLNILWQISRKVDVFKFGTLFYIDISSVPFGKFRC